MQNLTTPARLPFYLKVSQIILGLVAFFYILDVGQEVILPFIYSTLVAILLNPLVNFLHRIKINRALSIFIAIIIAVIVIGGILAFIGWQVSLFGESWPQLKQNVLKMFNDIVQWLHTTFGISSREVNGWIESMKSEGMSSSTTVIGNTIGMLGNLVILIFLIPVYIFMILYYKPVLIDFIAQMFPKQHHETVAVVLIKSKGLIQSYLLGLLIETAIVAVLNSVGLLILGIDYAILLGIIGALLNIIPYVGGLVAVALTAMVALATATPLTAVLAAGIYYLVQIIDNNLIVPYVVASKVKINGLMSLLVVFIGGALWGVHGMFLSIPLAAMVKVMCDHIEPLKPIGFLLGDTMEPLTKFNFNFARKRTKT